MSAVYEQRGATLGIDIISSDKVQQFIDTHTSVLDSSFQKVEMSDAMRDRLHRSDYIFSGLKTFHELGEAFPSLLDENGNRKPFDRFLSDVQKIDETYNRHYLRAEYGFIQASAEMAARWEGFSEDGDRYNLQYRTAGDDHVREEHVSLEGVTLPMSDPFWESYYPPNGWGCRCTVVQVRRSKYDETPSDEAMSLGAQAMQEDRRGIFRFNPGIQQRTVPAYNPYTISKCRSCPLGGKESLNAVRLAADISANQLCQACRLLHQLADKEKQSKKLTREDIRQANKAALQWADRHLPKTEEGRRLEIKNKDTKSRIFVNKRFINETFSKNIRSRRLVETMQTATHVAEWLPAAKLVRTEKGRHHDCEFHVFETEYKGKKIQAKAKVTSNIFLYTMRLR